MDESSLGARLKEERKRLALSQDDAGGLAGVSREMWGKYERNVGVPGGDAFARLLHAGFDVHYVLIGRRSGDPMPAAISKGGRALLDIYDSLDDQLRDAIDGVVRAAAGKLRPRSQGSRELKSAQVFHGDVGQVVRVKGNSGLMQTGDVNFGSQKKRD